MYKKPNIYPVFEELLQRSDKQNLLKQTSKVFWFTGLSGSGKTTIAKGVESKLHSSGYLTKLLDGDNIRSGISNNLSFSLIDREENIRRIAEISKLFLNCGIITLNCFVSPTHKIRKIAEKIIGKENLIDVYINASIETCENRDTKGLYKKARNGEITNLTGINSPFEPPKNPQLEIDTNNNNIENSIEQVVNFILPIIKIK
tara:strand:- start:17911 stop:18516 length:606 start_codon:yes stop_codon:yes gene_type:complete